MSLSKEQIEAIGQDEEERWQKTHREIVDTIEKTHKEFEQDRKLARDLTSEIVATRRAEDKAQLASDEAVAHGLSSLRKGKTDELEILAEQAYFARVVTTENNRDIEFRLGAASFPSQRIIDWRKAPISKLFYNYEEGDDFAEDIQGREREGIIKLKRSFQGKMNKLNVIETAQGTIAKTDKGWVESENTHRSRNMGHDGHLPPILSLITPEQFELITSKKDEPIVIQGVAGSGKTTVALHRLAWLLHEDNSDNLAENCMIVVATPSLKSYISTTLPELNVQGVKIYTYREWAKKLYESIGKTKITKVRESLPLRRFKNSRFLLAELKNFAQGKNLQKGQDPAPLYFEFLQGLVSKNAFSGKYAENIATEIKAQLQDKYITFSDLGSLLNLTHICLGYYPPESSVLVGLDHLVIDEVQDLGLVEIASLTNALNPDKTLTVVGDMAQKIFASRDFLDWADVLKICGFDQSHPLSLQVSYRTTGEIIKLANHLRNDPNSLKTTQTPRYGPAPSHIRAHNAELLADLTAKWIQQCLSEDTHSLSAIICRHMDQAQKLVNGLKKRGLNMVRLGYHDQFDFSPGVIVSIVHQIKGLEFRNVLLVETSEENYPSEKEISRNLLYVAVTRAEVKLDFISTAPLTALLPNLTKG